jgi:hypothetical protein
MNYKGEIICGSFSLWVNETSMLEIYLIYMKKWTSGKKHQLCFKLTGNRFEMLVEHNNQEKLIRFHFVVEVLANCG